MYPGFSDFNRTSVRPTDITQNSLNIKFEGNPSCKIPVAPRKRTNVRTHMMKFIAAFPNVWWRHLKNVQIPHSVRIYTYVFRIDLRTNSDYFLKHQLASLSDNECQFDCTMGTQVSYIKLFIWKLICEFLSDCSWSGHIVWNTITNHFNIK
jgi:hypothetical protein